MTEQFDMRKIKEDLVRKGNQLMTEIYTQIPYVEKDIQKSKKQLICFQNQLRTFDTQYHRFAIDCAEAAPNGYMRLNFIFWQQVNIVRASLIESIKELNNRIFTHESKIISKKMLNSSKRIEITTIIMLIVSTMMLLGTIIMRNMSIIINT
ncbi:MAG: hypothetical protein KAT43_01280 [Nanoarchaeota archaeon]|nr:hypothetical protein [Nanoarchaeota archaeon]